jgi:hypothetical protein
MSKIDEGNKIILEFMGYRLARCNNGQAWESPYPKAVDDVFNMHGMLLEESLYKMKFNSSWDWIMKAVKKINETGYSGGILYDLRQALMNADEETAFEEIVKFCLWYKEKTK